MLRVEGSSIAFELPDEHLVGPAITGGTGSLVPLTQARCLSVTTGADDTALHPSSHSQTVLFLYRLFCTSGAALQAAAPISSALLEASCHREHVSDFGNGTVL
jgi:hypothetical protein